MREWENVRPRRHDLHALRRSHHLLASDLAAGVRDVCSVREREGGYAQGSSGEVCGEGGGEVMLTFYRWRHGYAVSRLYDLCWWEGRNGTPYWILCKRMTHAKYLRLCEETGHS